MQVIGTNHRISVNTQYIECAHVSQTGEKKWSLVLDLKEMNPVTVASYDNILDASQALDELNRQLWEAQNGRGHGDILVANLPGNAAAMIMREAE